MHDEIIYIVDHQDGELFPDEIVVYVDDFDFPCDRVDFVNVEVLS